MALEAVDAALDRVPIPVVNPVEDFVQDRLELRGVAALPSGIRDRPLPGVV
ncbi:hypothetical protein [Streptomyces sp. NPDC056255]|uniref:hypothetical protein n=1 Tax=Streptomyces sp. NPDC056255 TaxID=3345764 RepID=UPI0035DA9E45